MYSRRESVRAIGGCFLILFIGFLLLFPCPSFSASQMSLLSFNPNPDAATMFSIRESETPKKLHWNLGTTADYAYKPFKAVIGGVNVELVRRYVAQHFYGTLGITDKISVSADLPVVWYERFRNPDTLTAASNKMGLGDLGMEAKLKFFDRNEHKFGMAVLQFVTFPTGDEKYFIAEDGFTGGGKLVVDSKLTDNVAVALNIGGLARKRYNAYSLDFGHQLLAGAGVSYTATDFLSVVGEAETRTPFADIFQDKETSPTEVRCGLQWRFGKDNMFAMNTGVGFGIINGSYLPQYRSFISFAVNDQIADRPNSEKKELFAEADIKRLEGLLKNNLLFGFDNSGLSKDTKMILDQVATILEKSSGVKHLKITGFTDSIGSEGYNKILGMRRAESVKRYLTQKGISTERIVLESLGEANPMALNNTSEGRRRNRRVEIKFQ